MKAPVLLLFILFPFGISAQNIVGKVTNRSNEPLLGAGVYWIGSDIGVITDVNGQFQIPATGISNKWLVASFTGYVPDTVLITDQVRVDFRLIESQTLGEVVVQGQRDGVIISDIDPIKTEQITQTELGKSACFHGLIKVKVLFLF